MSLIEDGPASLSQINSFCHRLAGKGNESDHAGLILTGGFPYQERGEDGSFKAVPGLTPDPATTGKVLKEQYERGYLATCQAAGQSPQPFAVWSKPAPDGSIGGMRPLTIRNFAVAYELRERYPMALTRQGLTKVLNTNEPHTFIRQVRVVFAPYIDAGQVEAPATETEAESAKKWQGFGPRRLTTPAPAAATGTAPAATAAPSDGSDLIRKAMELALEDRMTLEEVKALKALIAKVLG